MKQDILVVGATVCWMFLAGMVLVWQLSSWNILSEHPLDWLRGIESWLS